VLRAQQVTRRLEVPLAGLKAPSSRRRGCDARQHRAAARLTGGCVGFAVESHTLGLTPARNKVDRDQVLPVREGSCLAIGSCTLPDSER